MKCTVCGSEIEQNSAACPICGTKVESRSGVRGNAQADYYPGSNNTAVNKIDVMRLLDEAELTAGQLDALYSRYIELGEEYSNFQPKTTGSSTSKTLITVGWLTIIFGGLGIALLIAGYVMRGEENKRNEEEAQKQRDALRAKIEPQRNALLDEIPAVYERSSINGRFPLQYCNTDAVQKVRSYIQNMRADSLKEAFNLLEQEYHNQKMLNIQLQTLESQLKTEYAARGAYNAAVASAISNAQAAYYSRRTFETIYNR